MKNIVYKKLKDVCEILDAYRIPVTAKDRKSGIYPYYGANGLQDYVSEYIFDDELVLLAEDGGNFGSKDRPIAYRVSGKCWVNNHAHVLKAKNNINIDYLCYSLMFYNTEGIVNGATRKKLTQAAMREMVVPYRKMEEQERIVELIKSVFKLIEIRKDEIKLLNQLVQSRFVEIFGDPIQNPKEYPIHLLSEYIISLTSGSRGWAKYCVDDGNEWFITIKNVKDCSILTDNMQPINAPVNSEAKRTRVKEGDLLISITADLGRTGVVTKEIAEHGAYINQHLSCIRLNREILNPLFVAHYMESSAGKEQFMAKNQSAVKAGLNFNSINSLKLMVPPMKEQMTFIELVHKVDKSKLALLQCLKTYENMWNYSTFTRLYSLNNEI